jgi:hypothetical protein
MIQLPDGQTIEVKPGDIVRIRDARQRVVSAAFVTLRPSQPQAVVPTWISPRGIQQLEKLIQWNVLVIVNSEVEAEGSHQEVVEEVPSEEWTESDPSDEETTLPPSSEILDPLNEELFNEYATMSGPEAIDFLKSVSEERRAMFIQYEQENKARKTVLKAFED